MFRQMRRIKQQISREECVELLKTQKRGVLSLQGDDGYPYGVPIDFYFEEESERIYFHCAKQGHKIDAMNRCEKASLCVIDDGYKNEGEWALNFKSVIVFGRLSAVCSEEETEKASRALARKFTDDESYIDRTIEKHLKNVKCLVLTPEHMTGKRVKEK